ncbi:hypothetical protein [Aquibacillus rhizosphaerae]|uniref:DUF4352 domain-containing protein n=1 Tax=Aquibacillus rhizosphaerae TaxID=3051431 RepID=A0ABT7L8J8_9BACI|nr:hypothetical protein [Aquibacillus sp. LR5S19]MDL4842176.1 hypothetical protein [Aquibacillus sp. LR5S19]
MIKRLLIMVIVVTVLSIVGVYWMKGSTNAELVGTVKVSEQQDNFIVHIRVENSDEGIKIFRSLEYIGQEIVVIDHRTPLTSVNINKQNNDFTGSPVTKTLDPGDIYRPQEAIAIPDGTLDKGKSTMYVHTQFFIDGEAINIKSEKELTFE